MSSTIPFESMDDDESYDDAVTLLANETVERTPMTVPPEQVRSAVISVLKWSPPALSIHDPHAVQGSLGPSLINGMADINMISTAAGSVMNVSTPRDPNTASKQNADEQTNDHPSKMSVPAGHPESKTPKPTPHSTKRPSKRPTRTAHSGNFYDRHLDKKLVADRVVYCPELLRSISHTALRRWEKYQLSGLPSNINGLHPAYTIDEETSFYRTDIALEDDIRHNYVKYAARYCIPIASALLFDIKTWPLSFLNWSPFPRNRKYAIADGALGLVIPQSTSPHITQTCINFLNSLDKETRDILSIAAAHDNPAAVWEFKHPAVGDEEVMTEILDMGMGTGGKRFEWKFCPLIGKSKGGMNSLKKLEEICRGHLKREKEMEKWRDPGLDAPNPPWKKAIAPYIPLSGSVADLAGTKRSGSNIENPVPAKRPRKSPSDSQQSAHRTLPEATTSSTPGPSPTQTERRRLRSDSQKSAHRALPVATPSSTPGPSSTQTERRRLRSDSQKSAHRTLPATTPSSTPGPSSTHTERRRLRSDSQKSVHQTQPQAAPSSVPGPIPSQINRPRLRSDSLRSVNGTLVVASPSSTPGSSPTQKRRPDSQKSVHRILPEEIPSSTPGPSHTQAKRPRLRSDSRQSAHATPEMGTPSSTPRPSRNVNHAQGDDDDDYLSDGIFNDDPGSKKDSSYKPPKNSADASNPPKNQSKRRIKNAQSLIQQSWAEAVRNKCSVLVMSSGNYEFIGIRHRESKTLFITDIIHPHQPPEGYAYGTIQIGIYICAVLDAIGRATQIYHNQKSSTNNSGDVTLNGSTDHGPGGSGNNDGHHDSRSTDKSSTERHVNPDGNGDSSNSTGKGSTELSMKHTCGNSSLALKQAMSRNLLLISLRYDIYDSPVPAPFLRVVKRDQQDLSDAASTSSAQSESSVQSVLSDEPGFHIVLTEEKQPQSTGVVHIGTLLCDDPLCTTSEARVSCAQVIAKIGFTSSAKKTLRNEHEIYTLLHEHDVKGIPTHIGLFADIERYGEDDAEGPYALVLSYAGQHLHGRAHTIPREAKLSLLSTLYSIHSLGVVHGDIAGKNMCMLDSGEVSIIDFSHSWTCGSEAAKESEFENLCRELDMDVQEAMAVISPPPVEPSLPRRSQRIKGKAEERAIAEAQAKAAAAIDSGVKPDASKKVLKGKAVTPRTGRSKKSQPGQDADTSQVPPTATRRQARSTVKTQIAVEGTPAMKKGAKSVQDALPAAGTKKTTTTRQRRTTANTTAPAEKEGAKSIQDVPSGTTKTTRGRRKADAEPLATEDVSPKTKKTAARQSKTTANTAPAKTAAKNGAKSAEDVPSGSTKATTRARGKVGAGAKLPATEDVSPRTRKIAPRQSKTAADAAPPATKRGIKSTKDIQPPAKAAPSARAPKGRKKDSSAPEQSVKTDTTSKLKRTIATVEEAEESQTSKKLKISKDTPKPKPTRRKTTRS